MDILTKTYRAPNMLEALQLIQNELGSDAIVVSMRQIPVGPAWQVWKNPGVEVIAMKKSDAQAVTSQQGNQPQLPSPINEQKQTQTTNRPSFAATAYNQNLPATKTENTPLEQKINSNDPSVAETIKALNISSSKKETSETKESKEKKENNPEWRPFIPPHISTKNKEETLEKSLTNAAESNFTQADILNQLGVGRESYQKALSKAMSNAREKLISLGVDQELTNQLITTCTEILPSSAQNDEKRIHNLLKRQLEAEIQILDINKVFLPQPIFLIGSSGSGKTSTCAKLATYAMHHFHKRVCWICADTIGTGAIAQTRTYTDLLGIPLRLVYTPEELEETIKQETEADWIIVDTADCNPRNEESVVELGSFVTQIPTRTIFLTASATTKEIDTQQAIASFSPFRPKGIIVTKMDETLSFGSVFNLTWKSQLPLAFFTSGSHIFKDLSPANSQKLIEALYNEGFVQ